MTLVGDIRVGEIGKQIIWQPNPVPPPLVPIILTGSVVTMTISDPNGNRKVLGPFTIPGGGLSASYATTASDFIVGGRYTGQFIAAGLPGGLTLESNSFYFMVGDRL